MGPSSDRLIDAHKTVYDIMKKESIGIEDYTYARITDHISREYDLKVKKINFGPVLGAMVSGTLLKGKRKWHVHINDTMLRERQNFTLCHELSHFIWDCDYGNNIVAFSSTMNSEYNEDDEIEFLADNAAGVIMLPDMCIKQSLVKGLSFNAIRRKYDISYTALKCRLIQFLDLNVNMPSYMSVPLVNDYIEKDGLKDLQYLLNHPHYALSSNVDELYYS